MREELLAGLKVRLAGGTDRQGGGDGPMLVLLHGYGAPGSDLVPLWRQLNVAPETRFAFPEAPIALPAMAAGMESCAWWPLDIAKLEQALRTGRAREAAREVPAGLAEANAQICAMLDELEQKHDVRGEQLVLGGFSQGAMLACDVALRSVRPLAGLVLLSSTVVAEQEWSELSAKRRALRVLLSHGRNDPLLPFSLAERLRDLLTEAGVEVEFMPFNGGHGIAASVLDALGRFVTSVTRRTT